MRVSKTTLLIGGCALLSGLLVYATLMKMQQPLQGVIVARDLPEAYVLTQADLDVSVLTPGEQAAGVLSDPSAAIGRQTRGALLAGQLLREDDLLPYDTPQPLPARIPPDQVAFFVPMPLARMLGGAVAEGDRVDLILVADGDAGYFGLAQPVVQDVQVLQRRDEFGLPYDEASGGMLAGLLVQVTPLEAQRLAFALEHGTLFAVLKPRVVGMEVPHDG